jgi:hypothetical protein
MMYLSQQDVSLEIDKDMTHCHNEHYLHQCYRLQSQEYKKNTLSYVKSKQTKVRT